MKICQIKTGILPIPPNGHGAVEKLIWEYYNEFNKLGHECDIEYLDYIGNKYDIVHIHVANLANLAYERKIPYFFTCHDHHAYLYGKESTVFKENYNAIKNSIHSFVPAKFLVDYFDLTNLSYLSHGVNSEFFKFDSKQNMSHKLLCVANNGFIHDQSEDRKGFSYAINAAKELNLPITIVGPENNKKFFDKNKFDFDKLKIKYNLTEDELLNEYKNHTIFLHPSILEAGHPNLTILEALSCGLPVVGTFEKNNHLDGMEIVDRDVNQIKTSISKIIHNFEHYQKLTQKTTENYTWKSVCKKLLNYYNLPMKEQLISEYIKTQIKHKPKLEIQNTLKINFNDGAKVEILGALDKKYNVKFKDDLNRVLHESNISNNMWTKTNIQFYKKYNIDITELDTGDKMNYDLNFDNKIVKIINESPALGDNIAWISAVDEFQRQHNCEVHYFTPMKDLYENTYNNIKFFNYNDNTNVKYYATYKIGCFEDTNMIPVNYRKLNVQEIAYCILGLDWIEKKPKIDIKYKSRPLKNKYVCISTASTSGCKHWQNPNGWQQVVDYLKNMGYEVVVVQKEPLDYMDNKMLKNVEHPVISDVHQAIHWLNHCEFYIGLSSGFSWLSWALNKNVIMISGFSSPEAEFNNPHRIINKNVCNGCWNKSDVKFDRNNWLWCPENKSFECSKSISFDMVKEKIDKILKK